MRPSRRGIRFASVPPQHDDSGLSLKRLVMLRSAATASRLEARKALAALFAVFAVIVMATPASAALTFPPLTGRVVDDAHVLPADVQTSLTAKLADLQSRTSRQLVVVTLPDLQGDEISDYGYQLGRAWGIGQKGTNNGALFIVVPSEHKVRIEVGYGLEPILTDALTSEILQSAVLPKFKAGDIPGGIVDGTNAIVDQLGADTSTAEQKAADAERQQAAQANQPSYGHRHGSILGLIFPLIFVVFAFSGIFGRGRSGGGFLPALLLGGILGGMGRGGDDDEGGFGGGGGGGGFSGGGGSFGGGGSSGSW